MVIESKLVQLKVWKNKLDFRTLLTSINKNCQLYFIKNIYYLKVLCSQMFQHIVYLVTVQGIPGIDLSFLEKYCSRFLKGLKFITSRTCSTGDKFGNRSGTSRQFHVALSSKKSCTKGVHYFGGTKIVPTLLNIGIIIINISTVGIVLTNGTCKKCLIICQ